MKVVTPAVMARLESESLKEGFSDEAYMEKAGEAVAEAVLKRFQGHFRIVVVTGKGNNGGDGLVAARYLFEKGLPVVVYPLFSDEESSPLFKKQFAAYKGPLVSSTEFQSEDLVVDAIFGTGFKGALEGAVLETVERLNKSQAYTIAVDIPSGLNGTSGEVQTAAVKANLTVTLGLPKTGFFLGNGFEYLGDLEVASFGLPAPYLERAEASFELFCPGEPVAMPVHKRSWHKYERGYLVAFAGNLGMMGAAFLSSKAALRAGAGIVRLLCHKDKALLAQLPPEVLVAFLGENAFEELKRACAFMAGPGLGRAAAVRDDLEGLLSQVKKPMILDADALWWISQGVKVPVKAILTPHSGEMHRLLESSGCKDAGEYADRFDVTVVLKGAPTFIFAPDKLPLILAQAPAIMATAGSGDVLSGIIGSLLAQGLTPYEAAKTGVILHSLAGQKAAEQKGFGAIAGDFIECLPLALKEISCMHRA